MYRVAIIDDEPLIRENRPDIVITDICMPKMDGLKMIAGLKSEFPDMQIIILTGYREFEYARQAIELGVSRFLLKPSKMNDLEEAVDTVTRRLDQMGTPAMTFGGRNRGGACRAAGN